MSESPSAAGIAAGYAFTGPALDLGALLWDGERLPGAPVRIPLPVLNRHGLVAGATGTGKTRTLQLIAEQLSAQGVPVFLADVKGDLSRVSAPGAANGRVRGRAEDRRRPRHRRRQRAGSRRRNGPSSNRSSAAACSSPSPVPSGRRSAVRSPVPCSVRPGGGGRPAGVRRVPPPPTGQRSRFFSGCCGLGSCTCTCTCGFGVLRTASARSRARRTAYGSVGMAVLLASY